VALTADERRDLTDLANRAFKVVEPAMQAYVQASGMPRRFGLGVYDASDGGASFDPSTLESRAIADYRIDPENWGDRDYIATVRRKLSVAIRTGRDTADVARNAPELFLEGDMRVPGGVIGEVGSRPIAIGGSGFRGPEDAVFASLMLEAMKRLHGDYDQAPAR